MKRAFAVFAFMAVLWATGPVFPPLPKPPCNPKISTCKP
jgi:hypothetical protein